jgi:hypothetical protein
VSIADQWPSIRHSNTSEQDGAEVPIVKDGVPLRAPYIGKGAWVIFADAEYPGVGEDEETGREEIDGGVTTHYTVDGLADGTNTNFIGDLPAGVWDDSVFLPALGEVYMIGITLKAAALVDETGKFLAFNLGVGETHEDLVSEVIFPLTKGEDAETIVSVSFPVVVTGDLVDGGKIFITPSHDVEIWDKQIFIHRTYRP